MIVSRQDWMSGAWHSESIGRVCAVIDCKHVTAPFGSQGYPVASIGEIGERFINLSRAPRTTAEFYTLLTQGGRKPAPGDLIMTRNATVGRVSRVSETHPSFAMGQDVCLLRPNSRMVVSEFVQIALRSPGVSRQIEAAMAGSTFKRLNVQQVKQLRIPLPNRDEQMHIAAAVGDADDLIATLERLIAKKQAIKQGMMQQLLTGRTRLTGFDAEWSSTTFGSVAEEFTTLGDVVAQTGGMLQTGPFGSQLHASDYQLIGTPLVMPVNLGDNEIREVGIARIGATDVQRLRRHALRDGDIVFSRRGDVGRRSLVREKETGWLCGTGCLAARFGTDRRTVNPAYVAEYLGSDAAQTWLVENAVGGTMPNLNTSILAALPVLLPPKSEQDRIVTAFGDVQQAIKVLERLIAKQQAIKQGMMQQLLTGRIRLPVEATS